jgi:hypothetical protein
MSSHVSKRIWFVMKHHYTNNPFLDNTAYVLGQIPLMTLQTKGKM